MVMELKLGFRWGWAPDDVSRYSSLDFTTKAPAIPGWWCYPIDDVDIRYYLLLLPSPLLLSTLLPVPRCSRRAKAMAQLDRGNSPLDYLLKADFTGYSRGYFNTL